MSASGAAVRPAAIEKLHGGGKGPYDPSMETRVAKLEGAHDGVKQSQSILVMAVMGLEAPLFALAGIMVSLQIYTLTHLGGRIDSVEAKVDAIPAVLFQEFKAMRAEMTAQTAAIAGAITAARQTPPPAAAVPTPAMKP